MVASKRLGLVIGNAAHSSNRLTNSVEDAGAMARQSASS
jgi:hypothetical protein